MMYQPSCWKEVCPVLVFETREENVALVVRCLRLYSAIDVLKDDGQAA